MKYTILLKKTIFFGMIFTVVGLGSCDPPPPPEPTAAEKQLALLSKTWNISSELGAVTLNGVNVEDVWKDFSITIADTKTITAKNVAQEKELVWPTSSSFYFKENVASTIVRSDSVEIDFNVGENTLVLEFDYINPNGKVTGTEGKWKFSFKLN